MIGTFVFSETSPGAPGTAASSNSVAGSGAQYQPGIACPLDIFQAIFVEAVLQGCTGGALDVYLQISPDMGVSWYDFAHFAQLAAASASVRYTFSCSVSAQNLALLPVGVNLAPALAVNTVTGGAWSDRIRMVMVAGAGVSLGALQKITVMGQLHTSSSK